MYMCMCVCTMLRLILIYELCLPGLPPALSFICHLFSLFQELETRIETQKQTLQARDESIKKLLEMLQSKGDGKGKQRELKRS